MKFEKLVDLYEELKKTSSKISKTEAIAGFLRSAEKEDLPRIVLLLQGRAFPSYTEKDTGIAVKMAIKVISKSLGFSEAETMKEFKSTGDLGLAVEKFMERKKQKTLFHKPLEISDVFGNIRKLGDVEGKGSQERKLSLVSGLIASAKPKEAKYIIRTVLEELRIGVAEGIIRDAIAKAFLDTSTTEKSKESVKAVEWAWFMRSDYSEIVAMAKEKGVPGLRSAMPKLGVPIQPLLGEKSPGLEEAMESFNKVAVEFKYDGMRTQIHKDGNRVWLFTRRLEDVTEAFPDLVKLIREGVKADRCIIEGETLGTHPKNGEPLPFQELSKRIHRKYEINDMMKKIPIQTNLFDAMMIGNNLLFDKPFSERRKALEKIIREGGQLRLAKQLVTKNLKEAKDFYAEALRKKQEGVFVKNLEAPYQPGRRVAGGWLKVKPIMETLDLAITGGIWGTGKRAGWLGSFILSCRDEDRFLECGMMGTGIKEKSGEGNVTFKDLTRMLKPFFETEKGNTVKIRPKVVVEVAYEEIQKSPNYGSGFALRFPRLVRLRTDEKTAGECDTLGRLAYLYEIQKGKRAK